MFGPLAVSYPIERVRELYATIRSSARRLLRPEALLLLTAACVDAPTSPSGIDVIRPTSTIAPPIADYTFRIPSTNVDTVYRVNTGIYLPSNSTVIIHVRGAMTLHAISEQGYGSLGGIVQGNFALAGRTAPPAGMAGIYGWPGATGLAFQIVLYYGTGASGPGLHADPSDSTAAVSDTIRVDAGMMLQASRNGLNAYWSCTSHNTVPRAMECSDLGGVPAYDVGPLPAYTLKGEQTISVERLADDVTLSAVVATGDTGRTVTFTPQPLAANGAGGPMQWTWTPDSGSAKTMACAYGANPCTKGV